MTEPLPVDSLACEIRDALYDGMHVAHQGDDAFARELAERIIRKRADDA